MNFLDVAAAAEAVAEARATQTQREILRDLLARADAESLPHVARFLSGTPFPRTDARSLRLGSAAVSKAARSMLAIDDVTWRACHREVGDAGETLALLVEAAPPARRNAQRTLFDGPADALSVGELFALLARLAVATPAARPRLLEEAWRRMSSLEIKYSTRLFTGDALVEDGERLVEDAIAIAFGRPVASVRLANAICGDLGETASLAARGGLEDAEFRIFHPVDLMHADAIVPGSKRIS
jgi:DNA ligase-1